MNFVQTDAFAYMRDMLQNGRQYDIVVLDPPKLIRTRDELEDGRRKHFDLNLLAMQLVRPGGLLLELQLQRTARRRRVHETPALAPRGKRASFWRRRPTRNPATPPRTLQILDKTGAAPDHPVAPNCPENEYLRAVWMPQLT